MINTSPLTTILQSFVMKYAKNASFKERLNKLTGNLLKSLDVRRLRRPNRLRRKDVL